MSSSAMRVPGEWESHDACWLAFPHLVAEWGGVLEDAQHSVAELAIAIATRAGERVKLMVRDEGVETVARALIGQTPEVQYIRAEYADCWVRDTGPTFGFTATGCLAAACFSFNAWGQKFDMPEDEGVAEWIATTERAELYRSPLIVEGGAVDFDGTGLCLTTKSCLLNPNRHPQMTARQLEEGISALIDVRRFIWLDRGLRHDHTDGHVDVIARFIAPQTVTCMQPVKGDPNEDILLEVLGHLRSVDELEVTTIPSPGAVRDEAGRPLPATYCNFYIGNRAVIVPTYDVPADEEALAQLEELFPGREVVGLDAQILLSQGGAFHCITQQQPNLP